MPVALTWASETLKAILSPTCLHRALGSATPHGLKRGIFILIATEGDSVLSLSSFWDSCSPPPSVSSSGLGLVRESPLQWEPVLCSVFGIVNALRLRLAVPLTETEAAAWQYLAFNYQPHLMLP